MELTNLVGFVMPPVIDIVNRRIVNAKVRFLVSMCICVLLAVVMHAKELTSGNYAYLASTVGVIFTEAQVIYNLYWKESALRARVK